MRSGQLELLVLHRAVRHVSDSVAGRRSGLEAQRQAPELHDFGQSDGTGLELTDVYYKGRLILKRAEVPVLNVLYAGNTCGPYRDWLYSEDCFQATGTDVPSSGSGVRIANAPPSTLCESGSPGAMRELQGTRDLRSG